MEAHEQAWLHARSEVGEFFGAAITDAAVKGQPELSPSEFVRALRLHYQLRENDDPNFDWVGKLTSWCEKDGRARAAEGETVDARVAREFRRAFDLSEAVAIGATFGPMIAIGVLRQSFAPNKLKVGRLTLARGRRGADARCCSAGAR